MVNLTVCDQCSTPLGSESGMRLERIGDGFTTVSTLCGWETLDFCSWACIVERARGEQDRQQRATTPPPPPRYEPLPNPVIHQREA